MTRVVLAVGLLAGCLRTTGDGPHVRADAMPAIPDASCANDPHLVLAPVAITGTSPVGSLDVFHYGLAYELGGFCLPTIVIALKQTMAWPSECLTPLLTFAIQSPFDGTTPIQSGSLATTATYNPYITPTATTDKITFEVSTIEKATGFDARIAGRFVSTDPAWPLDLSIDMVTQNDSFGCGP